MEGSQVFAQITEFQDPIDASQQVFLREVIVQVEGEEELVY